MKKKQNALSGLSFVLTAAMALGTCLPYLGSIEMYIREWKLRHGSGRERP